MKIELVREKLERHTPERRVDPEASRAAVAVVLRERAGAAEVLLIERAIREGDPWSGHMAFPGGRLEAGDDSTRAAAARETREEVGVELAGAEYLGHVADRVGNPRIQARLVISAHAFFLPDLPGEQPFALQESEVQSAFWFPLAGLHASERHVDYIIPRMPDTPFPGILVGEPDRHIVWGLTYRFLEDIFDVLGRPLPSRPYPDLEARPDSR